LLHDHRLAENAVSSVTSQSSRNVQAPGATACRDRFLVIPAFNEEGQISGVLRQVAEAQLGLEIVVIDDGSKDRTAERARQAGVRVIQHPFNMGYGAALQTGYKYALRSGATLVVQMDADGQHDPREIRALMDPVLHGNADLVLGSRFLAGAGYRMGWTRELGRTLLMTVAGAFGLSITDPTSGFQAMNREVLKLYVRDSFPTDFPDLDVLLAAQRCQIRIEERRVSMAPSPRPSSIHHGLGPTYYLYKMILSIWAGAVGYSDKPSRFPSI
jgi:glycosyltransferase involved in cell wall biosynthesis